MKEQDFAEITGAKQMTLFETTLESPEQLSERAQIIPLDRFLLPEELDRFRQQLDGVWAEPDDFLRTRILRFLEALDPSIRQGLIDYIQEDIDMLTFNGFI
jgi:hypothetical protein